MGRSTRALVGGADGLCHLTLTGFNALGAIDPDVCRPFDRRRAGLALGEGAAFLVLEREDAARARGAVPIAELSGWAVGSEAHHITHPEREGTTAARLIQMALARGGVGTSELDYVNAHGTGTIHNDAMEGAALRAALGDNVGRVAVSSSKGQIGHTLGAAGAIEAAIAALAIARGGDSPDRRARGAGPSVPPRPRDGGESQGEGGGGALELVWLRRNRHRPSFHISRSLRAAPPAPTSNVRSWSRARGAGAAGSRRRARERGVPGAGPVPRYALPRASSPRTISMSRARAGWIAERACCTAVAARAAQEATGTQATASRAFGVIGGAAYGNVDASRRIRAHSLRARAAHGEPAGVSEPRSVFARGARFHLSRAKGPVLTTADLGVTGESAFVLAAELVQAGEADALAATSVEELSRIAERVLGPLCAGSGSWTGLRTEGASAVIVEEEARARKRGAPVLARVVTALTLRETLRPRCRRKPACVRSWFFPAKIPPSSRARGSVDAGPAVGGCTTYRQPRGDWGGRGGMRRSGHCRREGR